jgi:hypothetical protein
LRGLGVCVALGSIGCSQSDLPCLLTDCQEDELQTIDGPPEIQRVAWDCCSSESDSTCSEEGSFWYDVIVNGEPAGVSLKITLTDGLGDPLYEETHALPALNEELESNVSIYFLELFGEDRSECETLADCPDLYQSGDTTLFSCAESELSILNWTIHLDSSEAPAASSCGQWGASLTTSEDCSTLLPDS